MTEYDPLRAIEQAGLPRPDADSWQHSLKLQALIGDEITSQGPMPFSRFMELALYAPGLGYYTAGARKFGAEGDFVTAPEISPLFSHCLARQCQQVLAETGGSILEFGAGRGVMASDILLHLEQLDCLPERYYIVDLSPDLRQRQRETIAARAPHLLSRVEWLAQLPAAGFRGVVLANEVLDAMPVHLLQMGDAGWQELHVSHGAQGFEFTTAPLSSPELAQAARHLQTELGDEAFCPGYTTEVNLYIDGWLQSIADMLQQGMVLMLDYGFPRREYYHPERTVGTLMCHYRHRAHTNPLILPGLQDLTAHVDFTAVAEAADKAGLRVAGYTAQAQFLMGSGLLEALASNRGEHITQQIAQAQQVKKLTLPNEMGELFKAMALTRDIDISLVGFLMQDRRSAL